MINSSFYIFGDLGGGYMQYPSDYTKDIFSPLADHVDVKSALAVHRNGNLMYYCYLRKLEGMKYIGFCVLLNGLMFPSIKKLFPVFENAVTFMVTSGGVIGFNSNGDITATTSTFIGKEKGIDLMFLSIQNGLAGLERELEKLPPVSYGTSKSETKTFTTSDTDESIAKASCIYGCTYVLKDKGYNSAMLSGYKGVIARLNKEKKELEDACTKLDEEYKKVKKQKKQTDLVAFLICAVVVLGVVIYAVCDGLNMSKLQLKNANDTIAQKDTAITTLQEDLNLSNSAYSNLMRQYKYVRRVADKKSQQYDSLLLQINALEKEFSDFQGYIYKYQPFLFLNSVFDFNTGFYKFNYCGLSEGYCKIEVRVLDGIDSQYYSKAVYISKGQGAASIFIKSAFPKYKFYSFELIYNNKIIGGGRYYND